MFELSSIVLLCILALWVFGSLQRLVLLKRYNKEISPADYLHTSITLSMLILPAIYFYRAGGLHLFLSGFAFAFIVLTIGTMLGGLALMPYIMRYPLSQPATTVYSIFFYAPVSMVMIILGLYLRNPFVIGAAFAITSLWIGYIALLEKS